MESGVREFWYFLSFFEIDWVIFYIIMMID